MKAVILSDVCRGRDNNLNLLRMAAALAVLFSHAWPISRGPDAVQPLNRLTGYDLGSLAVFVFFAISGFLIARSFERQPTLRHWILARILRLFPALLVMLLLMVLVLGTLLTTLPLESYFSDPWTQSYLPNNLSLALRQAGLPGVFETLPYATETNGSLWTLYYEVLCYSAVMVAGLLGAFRRWGPLVAVTLLYLTANATVFLMPDDVPGSVRTFLALGMPFATGVAFYLCRDWLPLHPLLLVGLVGAAALAKGTPLYQPVMILALSYGVFVFAFLPGGFIRRYNAFGDYSYGIYIYAWPIQQTVVTLFGPMTPLENFALALPMTLAMAWASWTFVEKPALALVPHSAPPRTPPPAFGRAGDPAASRPASDRSGKPTHNRSAGQFLLRRVQPPADR
jgi:peptidoglycan/LPS O-acetylase OafA/YrhL